MRITYQWFLDDEPILEETFSYMTRPIQKDDFDWDDIDECGHPRCRIRLETTVTKGD